MRALALGLAVLASLGLVACDRGGQTANPNAPGSPGTGNPPVVATPAAPDSTSGSGPSGVKGSQPHPGSSGGDAVAGASGSGASAPQPGTGLQGGQGTGAGMAPGQAAGVGEGSKNRTTQGSVGN